MCIKLDNMVYIKPIFEKINHMAYFNYHANVQNLIKTGHCIKAEVVDNYNNIKPALVLHFDNNRPMPIRAYRFEDYFVLLSSQNIIVEFKN